MNQKLLAVMSLAVLMALAGCGKREEVVATIGGGKITMTQYRDALLQKFRTEDNVRRKTPEEREQVLRELALNEAKYQEALARKIDQRPEIKADIENMAKRKSLDFLYQTQVVDKVITDEAAKAFYDKSGEELRARHILLRTTPVDTAVVVDSIKVRARMDSIKLAIEKGLSFKAAAKLFSEDATSAADSGNLDWFPWGRMVDEFQEAAWKAKPGDIVGPVKTQYGYHLILVEERRTKEGRNSFEQEKDRIKAQMREAEGQKMNDIARQYLEELRKRRGLAYNEETLTAFRTKVSDPAVPKAPDLNPAFTEEEKQKVAATYDKGKVTVQELIDKVGNNAARVAWDDPQATKDLVHAIVEPKFLEEEAERSGLVKKAMEDKDVIEQKRQAIVRILEKEEVTDKVNPTEPDERAYYQSHLENYIQAEQRLIREVFIKEDSAKAASVRAKALKGENFTKLALRYNEKESTKPDTGRIGPFEQKRFGLIGSAAFALQNPGDISDVVKSGKNFSVIQLLNIVPSRTKSFEEARAQVARELRMAKTDEAQKALEASLLEKYKLKMNADKLAHAFPDNEQAATKPDTSKKG